MPSVLTSDPRDRGAIDLVVAPLAPAEAGAAALARGSVLGLELAAPRAARIFTARAKAGRRHLHPSLKVLHKGAAWVQAYGPAAFLSRLAARSCSMTEPYSLDVKWPRSLSATFRTNATLSLKPSGAAMTYPLDARDRSRHAIQDD